MTRRCIALLCFGIAAASAATPEPPYQAMIEALNRANAAVVGLQVTAAEGARSASSLGQERMGSGVVIGADGLILTIGYLVLEADTIQVTTQDGRSLPARLVGYDVATGFGLVRALLPLRGVTPVRLGSGADTDKGEAVLASIGGEAGGVAMIQLVSRRPFSGYWEYHIDSALFTSPPIGNHSGAALFNKRGELLGIGSLFVGDALGESRPSPGNMFVPVDLLKPILAEMQQTGTTRASHRPWIGLNSAERGGRVLVVRVNADSPAQEAGLRAGDILVEIDGKEVRTLEAFYKALWARERAEEEVRLTVITQGSRRLVVVKPVDRTTTMAKPPGI